jgi:hypothetical protein
MDEKNGERKAIEPPADRQATSFFAQDLAWAHLAFLRKDPRGKPPGI